MYSPCAAAEFTLAANEPVPVETTALGVRAESPGERERTELALDHGVRVTDVAPDSPAAKAGLEAGDVIVSFDGQGVDDARDLRERAAALKDGRTVAALVRRGSGRSSLRSRCPPREVSPSASPADAGDATRAVETRTTRSLPPRLGGVPDTANERSGAPPRSPRRVR